jgi:hypothetical protein
VLHSAISCKSLTSRVLLHGSKEMEITWCEIGTVRQALQNLLLMQCAVTLLLETPLYHYSNWVPPPFTLLPSFPLSHHPLSYQPTSLSWLSSILKMEATCSPRIFVTTYKTALHHNLEDHNYTKMRQLILDSDLIPMMKIICPSHKYACFLQSQRMIPYVIYYTLSPTCFKW